MGTNPGTCSTGIGHYFARPGNPFWKLLYDAGLIPVQLSFEQDEKLLDFGYGLTDIAKKPTTGIIDLSDEDYRKGILVFRRKIHKYAPKIICFIGKDAFRRYFEFKDELNYGLHSKKIMSSRVFIVHSMSGKTAVKYEDRFKHFKELRDELSKLAVEDGEQHVFVMKSRRRDL